MSDNSRPSGSDKRRIEELVSTLRSQEFGSSKGLISTLISELEEARKDDNATKIKMYGNIKFDQDLAEFIRALDKLDQGIDLENTDKRILANFKNIIRDLLQNRLSIAGMYSELSDISTETFNIFAADLNMFEAISRSSSNRIEYQDELTYIRALKAIEPILQSICDILNIPVIAISVHNR